MYIILYYIIPVDWDSFRKCPYRPCTVQYSTVQAVSGQPSNSMTYLYIIHVSFQEREESKSLLRKLHTAAANALYI